MNQINDYSETIFERIKHTNEYDKEYWYARELQVALHYKEWRKFSGVIEKAKTACDNSDINTHDHFVGVDKMVDIGSGAHRKQDDYKLSRYACYLIVQNADSRKQVVALGQTYFAVQTRKQELTEKEYDNLTEDEKRFYQRSLTRRGNYSLNQTAKNCGVKNFDKFHNAGYRGDILDNMGSEELIANLLRISQTEAKLKKDNISSERAANETHYNIGKNIREVIAKNGGTMPEELPTPKRSLKDLERNKKQLK